MSEPSGPAEPPRSRLPAQLRTTGLIILIAGLIAAAAIYLSAGEPAEDPTDQITSARLYEYNLERIGGMAAVYTDRFNRWFARLWHGRTLAATVAVIATLAALFCAWLAHLVAERLDVNE